MKKGKLAIEFAITKDGKVPDMRLTSSSGDVALDRAAWAAIVASSPFPPLPSDFTGPYLALRFRFYYNPDKSDLTRIEVSISPPGMTTGFGWRVEASYRYGDRNQRECRGVECQRIRLLRFCVRQDGGQPVPCPSVLPNPPFVTLTAVSKADRTASASVTVHIVQAPPH